MYGKEDNNGLAVVLIILALIALFAFCRVTLA